MTEAEALRLMIAPGQIRPTKAFRQGVIQIWVTRGCDKSCYGCTQGSNLSGRPGAITVDQFEIACKSLKGYFGVVGMFGGNPCQPKGTLIYTSSGIFPIEDLEDKVFRVRNTRGELQPATCWLAGKGRQLYEIKLRGGHSYFATADHEWPALKLGYVGNHKRKDLPSYCPRKQEIPLGKLKTTELKPGMRLPIPSSDSLGFGSDGTAEDGFLAGWTLGDGWVVKKHPAGSGVRTSSGKLRQTNNYRRLGLVIGATDQGSGIASKLSKTLSSLGTRAAFRAVKACVEINVQHSSVDTWMERFGLLGKKYGLPSAVWTTAGEEFRKGLIDGLFSADGNVEVSRKRKYTRIRLTSAHEKLVRDMSALLGFYGIKSQIEKRVRVGKFPNKKDYGRRYVSYTLSVSNAASVERFARLFPLTHVEKNQRLQGAVGRHKTDDVEATNIEIVSVIPTNRYEDVWDIHVGDDTHTFQLAHCVTGNCTHQYFEDLCAVMVEHVPFEQRGIWCNNPLKHGKTMRRTFNPAVSNLNVHLDRVAYQRFKEDWPECNPVGLDADSKHSPPFVAMKDVLRKPCSACLSRNTMCFFTDPGPCRICGGPYGSVGEVYDEEKAWELISGCDINRHWSAMIGVFRGELRAWFCEIAGAQAMLHQYEEDYPDTGIPLLPNGHPDIELKLNKADALWWQLPMEYFKHQVRKHCMECGIPLRMEGELAVWGKRERVSETHRAIYRTKQQNRRVELITVQAEVDCEPKTRNVVDYLIGARKR